MQVPAFYTKKKAEVQANSTFEIIAPQPAHSETSVTMRLPKEVGYGIDYTSDLAPARLRQFAHAFAKTLGKINLQYLLPSRRCSVSHCPLSVRERSAYPSA